MPPPSTVKALLEVGKQMVLDGFQSIKYVHLIDPVTMSQSVITYFLLWVDVFFHQGNVSSCWCTSLEWLQVERKQRVSAERREVAEKVIRVLDVLPWGINKAGWQGEEPISNLTKYLGTNWALSMMMEDMLDILADHITNDPTINPQYSLQHSHFIAKILDAYNSHDTDTYMQNSIFCHIQEVADNIVQKQHSLLTTYHLGNTDPHWVTIIVDGLEVQILYSDLYHNPPPYNLLDAYRWWISQHSETALKFKDLPTGIQTDSNACGFFADNSLEHYVYGVPLITTTSAKTWHMRSFLNITQKILASMSLLVI